VTGTVPGQLATERRKQHPYDELPAGAQFLLRCLVALMAGLFLAWLGGKLMPSAEAAKRVLAKSYLPWLTATDKLPLASTVLPGTTYPGIGQRSITVLSIEDADLQAVGIKWPPNLGIYGWLINQMISERAQARPRAIFLDVLLIDPRPEDEVKSLLNAACDAARLGVPVYLASIPGQAVSGSPETQLFTPQDVNGQQRPCMMPASPFTSEDTFDRATWEYPLCGRGLPSAALALACAHDGSLSPGQCRWQEQLDKCAATRPRTGLAGVPDAVEDDNDGTANSPKLALVWPAKGSTHNSNLLRRRVEIKSQGPDTASRVEYLPVCADSLSLRHYLLPLALILPQDGPPDWLKSVVPAAIAELLPKPKPDRLCPYNDLLPMRGFFKQGTTDEVRAALTKDRIVLIGANFIGHSDRHSAPLHLDVAGVQVHAMALDNLLSYGTAWRKVDEFNVLDWTSAGTAYALLSVLLMVLFWEVREALHGMARTLEHKERAPRSDWLFGKRGPAWFVAGKNLFLAVVTLGRLPARRRGKLPWVVLIGYLAFTLTLLLGLIGLLFYAANHWFRIGPLSQVEYVLAPLALGFIDQGHQLARGAVLLWKSGTLRNAAYPHHPQRPAQFIREHRELRRDEGWARVVRDSQLTLPPPIDTAALQAEPSPERPNPTVNESKPGPETTDVVAPDAPAAEQGAHGHASATSPSRAPAP
jgi:CHASE2 domain